MSTADIKKTAETKMGRSIDSFKGELQKIRTIGVQPWEKPMIQKVEKAIRESDLGLNPSTTGDVIRVPMPALTEERRRDLTKVVKGLGEDCKVAVRNLRREANEHGKKMLKD